MEESVNDIIKEAHSYPYKAPSYALKPELIMKISRRDRRKAEREAKKQQLKDKM
jgi:hypothetical protein